MLSVERHPSLLVVDDYVWVLDPHEPMAGPIDSGGRFTAITAPGCWGPMITPDFPAGHEVCRPVEVVGATPGDAVAIHIERIQVLTRATTSGVHTNDTSCMEGSVPFVGKKCPSCGTINPDTVVEGVGQNAVLCRQCRVPVHSCVMSSGYTMLFSDNGRWGITTNNLNAAKVLTDPAGYLQLPRNSKQYPTNLLARGDMPGIVARVEPMIGNIGTMPGCRVPSCQNSGDIAPRLLNDAHPLRLSEEDLERISDAHLDDNLVSEGVTLIYPVHIEGAGVYLGDVHAMQSDGEVAGHTTDVAAEVTLRVELLKGLDLPGPLIIPPADRLPMMIRPLSADERTSAKRLADEHDQSVELDAVPIVAVGASTDVRSAVEQAMRRLAQVVELDYNEVRNRVTISGCVEIARLTGTVHVGMRFPLSRIRHPALREQLSRAYGLNPG